jgi:hypothetical protein
VLDDESHFIGGCDRALDETFVSHESLVAPEVLAADVAEGEPDAGVHRGVVGGVFAFDGRMAAREEAAAGGVDGSPVGAADRVVAEDVRRDGMLAVGDDEPVGPGLGGETGRDSAGQDEDDERECWGDAHGGIVLYLRRPQCNPAIRVVTRCFPRVPPGCRAGATRPQHPTAFPI